MKNVTITYFARDTYGQKVVSSCVLSLNDLIADILVSDRKRDFIPETIKDLIRYEESLKGMEFIDDSIIYVSYVIDKPVSDLAAKNEQLETELTQYKASFAEIQDTLNELYDELDSTTFTDSELCLTLSGYILRIKKVLNGGASYDY